MSNVQLLAIDQLFKSAHLTISQRRHLCRLDQLGRHVH
jgi:hypothetical protein